MKSFLQTLLIAALLLGGYRLGRYFYFQPAFDPGEDLPLIVGALPDGQSFSSIDLRGNYVLVDFWGSWCGPCLAEMPMLRKVVQQFAHTTFDQEAGFEMVTVAIEPDRERWRRSLERRQLPGQYHLFDQTENLRFFDGAIARQFGVREVPTKYLLDPRGRIVLVNPEFDALIAYLQERVRTEGG